MSETTFFMQINEAGHQVIRQHDSDLAITVFRLALEPFVARTDKLHLFGEIHGEQRAFQCDQVTFAFETEVIGAALQWYARSQGWAEMSASMFDPRPSEN